MPTPPAIHPVILCGGSGTRLWPLSPASYLKQLLALIGQRTILQDTLLRATSLPGSRPPLLISNQDHRFLVRDQCRTIDCTPAATYLKPTARNTAPAIALAALHIQSLVEKPDAAAFNACPAQSIDYAVMQPTQRAAIVAASFGWSDVGSWNSLWQISPKNAAGHVALGDTYMAHIKTNGRTEHLQHLRVHRPWGWYEGIDAGERFQVKRIMVRPGERLSLQMHHHRAEHWVVVSGTAKVTMDGKEVLLSENQSTYIPLGHTHRLANPGKLPLHMIEVQSGSYLGEDDIVRFEDI